ncbi:MAG: EAL domain-containing protein [Sporomusaceae bacterium]|nr:EAL domain-containing protein [Sporomusaceae bacterium]
MRPFWAFKLKRLLYSLQAKFLLAFLLLSLVPLHFMETLEYFDDKQILIDDAYRSLYSASFQTASGIDTFIQSNKTILAVEARLPDLADYFALKNSTAQKADAYDRTMAILESFRNRDRSYIVSYGLINLAGKDILDTDEDKIGRDFSHFSYFQEALATGAPYVSSLELSQDTLEKGFFYFSCPVLDQAGRQTGVLVLQYRAEILHNLLNKNFIQNGPESFAILLDENFRVLADSRKTQITHELIKSDALLHEGLGKIDSPAPYFTIPFPDQQGEPMAGVSTRIGSVPWFIVFLQPEDVFLQPIYAQIEWKRYFVLLIAAIAAIFAVILSRHFSRPILHLTNLSRQVTAGDLKVEAKISTHDEIGLLTYHFNQMIRTMRFSQESLEQKVEERTVEIVAANQELVAMNEEVRAMNETLLDINRKLESEVAIRCQTEQELLRRERQYGAITSLLTCEAEDFGALLSLILRDALQLIKAPGGYIGLYGEQEKTLVIHYIFGQDESKSMEHLAADETLQRLVYDSGEMIQISDYRQYQKRAVKPGCERLSSIIMLPLKEKGCVKGILVAGWFDEVYPIRPDEVAVLRQFSDLAALALQRAAAQEQIRTIAFHDSLTGLPNRASLSNRLQDELVLAQRLQRKGAVLFVDLDDLKSVTDTLGHLAGDEVIKQAALYIRNAVETEAFVARISGDEFIVIASGVESRVQAALLAEKLVKALCQEYVAAGEKLHLSASIGLVVYPEDADNAEEILKRADSAMYAAKQAGRNCWRFYEPALLQEASEKVILTNALRQALEKGELYLEFQPLMSLQSNDVWGFEALLRWYHPIYQQISPARFIPLAEASGLIVPIGRWVLQEACLFAKDLADLGRDSIHVAVNISSRQLASEDFVESVCHSIEKAGIEAKQLELEVTESNLIESMELSVKKLSQLRSLGVGISLDDFGTGYSSLTYLRDLPATILKIDKSFVDQISMDQMQLNIVGSIVSLGHSLEMTVVAEGVETAEQLNLLRLFHCDCIQGYIFGRPLKSDKAIQTYLQKKSC